MKKKLSAQQKSWLGLGSIIGLVALAYLAGVYWDRIGADLTGGLPLPGCSGTQVHGQSSHALDACRDWCESVGGTFTTREYEQRLPGQGAESRVPVASSSPSGSGRIDTVYICEDVPPSAALTHLPLPETRLPRPSGSAVPTTFPSPTFIGAPAPGYPYTPAPQYPPIIPPTFPSPTS